MIFFINLPLFFCQNPYIFSYPCFGDKESNTTEKLSPIHFSAKFFDYWDKYLAEGIRKEDIKLELGKDFVTQKFSEKCKKEKIWPVLV